MSSPKQELQKLGKKIADDINKGKNPSIDIPVRALSNIVYDQKKCTISMGNAKATRYFFNVAHSKKFMQTAEVAAISKDLVDLGKHASLRDVFYMAKRTIPNTKVNLVDEQSETDKAIEDLELVTECAREQLNINANKMGSVAGRVIVEDHGDKIDWSKLGSGGWSIPSNVEDVKFLKSDAKYIIYMEKAAVWERLHEDKYWEKQHCIIMCSQGQATRGIRRLLQRMQDELKLPVYVLTDFDPWGIYIYSVLKYGSISLAHITEKLSVGGCKFLGITADDIIKYDLKKHFIKFEENDAKRLAQITKYDWFKDNKAWQRQFKMMKEFKAKAEIQAMSARGISFISEKYLPDKIKNQDWIE
ncbi:MAG: DNA topoisomerase IV subunit A [Candidatus Nanoarchaeia archaeon]|nr:DNA topoisomerase IV subunit A [Candidatus Nanoarchaeia archaeon]